MKNTDQFDSELFEKEFESERPKIIDYVGIIRASLVPIILIFIISMIVTFIYLKNYPVNYRATTIVRVEKPRNGILESQSLSFNLSVTEASDRYLSNQIEILKGYYIRDNVAKRILDTLKATSSYSSFYYVVDKVSETETKLKTQESLRRRLLELVKIDIKKGVDALTITVDGLSFHEIQMIVNIYANVFVEYSKEINKEDLINVKKFLEIEKEKKYSDLNNSEASLEVFQKESGFVTLDNQSRVLIDAISKYDAMKNEASIELRSTENELGNLKMESERIDTKLYDYVSGQITQPYITELQRQIAELEVKRDLEITSATDPKVRDKILNETKVKLEKLNKTLVEKTEILRTGLVSETPQEVRSIAENILLKNLKANSLKTKIRSIGDVLGK
ncbi:MAG: Wzz/FepE/Etk N-terminal domain-containing protein, partial [Ignavibacteria bacterium]